LRICSASPRMVSHSVHSPKSTCRRRTNSSATPCLRRLAKLEREKISQQTKAASSERAQRAKSLGGRNSAMVTGRGAALDTSDSWHVVRHRGVDPLQHRQEARSSARLRTNAGKNLDS
jgi:DNA-binding Lrp family transcriptional regulator